MAKKEKKITLEQHIKQLVMLWNTIRPIGR